MISFLLLSVNVVEKNIVSMIKNSQLRIVNGSRFNCKFSRFIYLNKINIYKLF